MTAPAWTLTHDRNLFAIPTPHLAPVAPEQVAAEPTPLFVAACQAVPGVACPKCAALLDEPCRTAAGQVSHKSHVGRCVK